MPEFVSGLRRPAGHSADRRPDPRPGTIYAIGKVACEEFLKTLHLGYGLESTTLRLFATYGAGHKPNLFQGIVNIILTQIQNGDELIIKGSLLKSAAFSMSMMRRGSFSKHIRTGA